MKLVPHKHFGAFAGNALASERAVILPVMSGAPRGTAYCESCRTRKPIAGKSVKGWRCGDCRPRKIDAKKA